MSGLRFLSLLQPLRFFFNFQKLKMVINKISTCQQEHNVLLKLY